MKLQQEVFDLFDKYVHGNIDRREFLDNVSKYTLGGMTALGILDYLSPNYALAQQVKQDDPRIETSYAEYESPKGGGKIRGLLALPKKSKEKIPAVVVVHENRGLNPYIEDVARRVAIAGFIGFAPDALTPLGGYPGNDDEGRQLQRQRDRSEMLEDFIAAFQFIKSHEKCNGIVGVVGFCFGGWISNMMAVRLPDLKAAVPFYGKQPDKEEVASIQAPLQLHFAELDQRVNEGWPDYEEALKQHSKSFEAFMYPGVQHGFHNDTTPRYDKESAELAWNRTVEFFNSRLK